MVILEARIAGFGLYVPCGWALVRDLRADTSPIAQILANLLALAGVCPFVGSLSDLIGRRYVAIIGVALVCIGMIVSSTANTMNNFIGIARRKTI
jgi:MFS family permease